MDTLYSSLFRVKVISSKYTLQDIWYGPEYLKLKEAQAAASPTQSAADDKLKKGKQSQAKKKQK